MYHHYTTKGLILASYEHGEANRMVVLLTPMFGLIRGHIQGARLLKSKMRYRAEPFTSATFGLIRGRHYWKIIQIIDADNLLTLLRSDDHRMTTLTNIASLVKRFCQGEGESDVYDIVMGAFTALARTPATTAPEILAIYNITAIRLLATLGYHTDNTSITPLTSDLFSWHVGHINTSIAHRSILEREISHITELTQL